MEGSMAATPLEKMIDCALKQARAELMRLYADGDIGKIELNCGKQQIRVKATPERIHEPVTIEQ
jgi:hypothetical protein